MQLEDINRKTSETTAHISMLEGDHTRYQRERGKWDPTNPNKFMASIEDTGDLI